MDDRDHHKSFSFSSDNLPVLKIVDIRRVVQVLFLVLTLCVVGEASGQEFDEYGFSASFPCELTLEANLDQDQIEEMGIGDGVVSWTSFQCGVRTGYGQGVIYRVIAARNAEVVADVDAWIAGTKHTYEQRGYRVRSSSYRGNPACMIEGSQTVRGREFESVGLAFVRGRWSYTLRVSTNTGNKSQEFNTIKSGIDLR